jgi:outer membrane protein TolC
MSERADKRRVFSLAHTRVGIGSLVPAAIMLAPLVAWSQTAPASPNASWHPPQEESLRRDTQVISSKFAPAPGTVYSLAELIDFAESHNPDTRLAWARARAGRCSWGRSQRALSVPVRRRALTDQPDRGLPQYSLLPKHISVL